MAGITPFNGEFFRNPIPLEMSIGTCNHGCSYCFANAKPSVDAKESRKEVQSTLNWLATYHEKHSLEAQLLQRGYPVCVSNRTDPFSRAGESDLLPIMEVMRDMDLPMMIQTKGGRKALDFAKTLKPSLWYVSISFDQDHEKLCRAIEPGAPGPSERLAMVHQLRKIGHRVVIGWNPCVEQWVTDPRQFAKTLKKAGAEGVWIQPLHFSRLRAGMITDKQMETLGRDLVESSIPSMRGRFIAHSNFDHIAREACKAEGLEVFSDIYGERTEFWKPAREVYEHTFPIMQDLINILHDEGHDDNLPISAAEFTQFFNDRLPTLKPGAECGHTLASQSWTIAKIPGYSNHMTLQEVIHFGMRQKKAHFHPMRNTAFSYAAELNDAGEIRTAYTDSEGHPIFVWCPNRASDPATHPRNEYEHVNA